VGRSFAKLFRGFSAGLRRGGRPDPFPVASYLGVVASCTAATALDRNEQCLVRRRPRHQVAFTCRAWCAATGALVRARARSVPRSCDARASEPEESGAVGHFTPDLGGRCRLAQPGDGIRLPSHTTDISALADLVIGRSMGCFQMRRTCQLTERLQGRWRSQGDKLE
jgi:hypothetical protein